MQDGASTLTQFLAEEQRRIPGATGELTSLLNSIATACKMIGNAVAKGGLVSADEDVCKHLESVANSVMVHSSLWAGQIAGLASEDEEGITPIPSHLPRGKYLLVFDPLNGSGNLDINFMAGTIFSVLRTPDSSREVTTEDFLQSGAEQVCAGMVQYGASTRMVLTLGNGVNGFTLDRDIGEFVLTQRNITIPAEASTFAINASNERFWEPPVKRYVEECLAGKTGARGRDFGMRWVASLVAETYRVLMRGGVFLYPLDEKTRDSGGRLGLLYEANPISFLIEQAGGAATTGRQRVMEVEPKELHQRAPFIFGTKDEVERIARYHQEYRDHTEPEAFAQPLFSTRSLFR